MSMRLPDAGTAPVAVAVESEPSFGGVPSAGFDITMHVETKLHDMSGPEAFA